MDFEAELRSFLNRTCQENASNTPDFVLAEYLFSCLNAFNKAVDRREQHYGRANGKTQSYSNYLSLQTKQKPTIETLERLLQSEDATPIIINPDGTITDVIAAAAAGQAP